MTSTRPDSISRFGRMCDNEHMYWPTRYAPWKLDPAIRFLNHGSFGACPQPVLDCQAELRERLERDPHRFLVHDAPRLLAASRELLAAFVGADPADLVFVDNATTAVNTVLASFDFQPGDEVLTTNHGYRACNNAAAEWAARRGARVVAARIPFPVDDAGRVEESLLAACSERTRLAIVDHVTSPTALVLPIESIIRRLQERGIRVVVDGAHAPGMLPLHLDAWGAEYYTGNAHKWLCAPKGAAFLHVRRDMKHALRPLVFSHGASLPDRDPGRFQAEFGWMGTNDPTAWICVGEAITFGETQHPGGWRGRMDRNHRLAVHARELLCRSLQVAAPCPESMVGSMAAVVLPPDLVPAAVEGDALDPLQRLLRERHGLDVPVVAWPRHPERLVRVSAQLYNEIDDYEVLAQALASARRKR